MHKLRLSRPDDGSRAVEIWAAAVDATHHFLLPRDRLAIGEEVAEFLPQAPLVLAVDSSDRATGFLFAESGVIEALFVDPACHGQGIGHALVRHAVEALGATRLEVNEQNMGARAFYARMGFAEIGRSALEGQGRPYPLIQMKLRA